MKIDIEGMESDVLDGAEKIISEHNPKYIRRSTYNQGIYQAE